MNYLPNTDADRKQMLAAIGVESVDDLFACIPKDVRFDRALDVPEPMAELSLLRHMQRLANCNINTEQMVSFLGGGIYDHYLPSAVDHIISRGEFFTAYTPYQPEVSQGTLQAVFEYQTMVAELTGMDAANASMYDGATALAEAAMMARRVGRKGKRVVMSTSIHPEYRQVVHTYLHGQGWEIVEVPTREGITDVEALEEVVNEDTFAVLMQNPNFFGLLEPVTAFETLVSTFKTAQLVVACDPISLGVLRPPSTYGANIVVGEGQPLGNPMSFGGPHLGFFAADKRHMRSMPGRIIGQTQDVEGRRGFVMTLQTREQHIRRERATSNICSNEALNALAATVYLSLMGKQGFQEVAQQTTQKAHYAAKAIAELPGFELAFDQPFFKEFVIKGPGPANKLIEKLLDDEILAGVDLGRFDDTMSDCLLVAVTEKRTKEEIDYFVERLGESK